jgi:hypothetical protein
MDWTELAAFKGIAWAAQVAQGVGTLVALFAIWATLHTANKQSELDRYRHIDELYLQLQMVMMQDRRLGSPAAHMADREFAAKYDLYAFMVWNFLETIYDRCRGNRELCDTWQPILEYEGTMHADWFNQLGGISRFKPKFRGFMNEGAFAPKAAECPLRGRFPALPAVA